MERFQAFLSYDSTSFDLHLARASPLRLWLRLVWRPPDHVHHLEGRLHRAIVFSVQLLKPSIDKLRRRKKADQREAREWIPKRSGEMIKTIQASRGIKFSSRILLIVIYTAEGFRRSGGVDPKEP